MDIRKLTDDFAVSPQIDAADLATLAAAGFRSVICNRPDAEAMPEQQAEAIGKAAEAAGISFVAFPVTHQTLTPEIVAAQSVAMRDLPKPILAYCASGTRSSIVWSYAQAGQMSTDAIIAATSAAGYDLAGMRGSLDQLAAST